MATGGVLHFLQSTLPCVPILCRQCLRCAVRLVSSKNHDGWRSLRLGDHLTLPWHREIRGRTLAEIQGNLLYRECGRAEFQSDRAGGDQRAKDRKGPLILTSADCRDAEVGGRVGCGTDRGSERDMLHHFLRDNVPLR